MFGEGYMKFTCVFSVRDIKKSREFYENIFGLKVTENYGENIVFDCGLTLQQNFDILTGIPKEKIMIKSNNCEIYFEKDEFDDFVRALKFKDEIELLHDEIEQPWGQHVIRLYDPDKHLIEVGESMKIVVKRFLVNGMDIDQIKQKMNITENEIYKILIS